jgi:predicted Zn-dependent protease
MGKYRNALQDHANKADFWSIYVLHEQHEELSIRKGVQEPVRSSQDKGALITVIKNGCPGYASTQDLSESGLRQAYNIALEWAERFSEHSITKGFSISFTNNHGNYAPLTETPMHKVSLEEKLFLLRKCDGELQGHKFIVDSLSSLWSIESLSFYENSKGADISQSIYQTIPTLNATAYHQGISQTKTLGGMRAFCRQGGFESLLDLDLPGKAIEIVKDACDLVQAENCPTQIMDILVDPDQMMLQIHESIGHPLELDRILGDERNYAGISFVTLDMFGSYKYGSSLLNITFDPTIQSEFASYGYDDEGTKAHREYIIKDGILLRPLGGVVAQARASINGVANARSSSWNRPPIDRMSNLNLEPGKDSFSSMVSSIRKGIYLKSNSSWSIDDSRNKFQFGCEWGQLIEDGRLTKIVRNPNYRGISANFWRSLDMVGDPSTFLVMGTPFCGKGEPNQCIRVGHASPVCLFRNIDVFGGE